MLPLRTALLLSPYLGTTFASILSVRPDGRTILPRAGAVNGSCISAPDTSCVSLVGLCVSKIASGQIGPTAYWTDSVCVAAATCATMGSVLDAACCAGTCKQPIDIGSLDVNKIYKAMVGTGCTTQPQNCALTWQPFIDWYYSTIQATGTNLYPASGDDVLDRWQDIATWTGFCVGDRCADGKIPYSNFNDWFHYSTAVIATTPGTPQYVPLFPTIDENLDNTTPNVLWPCLLDDEADCWWDYGPPPPGTIQAGNLPAIQATSQTSQAGGIPDVMAKFSAQLPSGDSGPGAFEFGRAPYQPSNIPPPVYVNGELVPLVLNGTPVQWNITNARRSVDVSLDLGDLLAAEDAPTPTTANVTESESELDELAINPATCKGPLDVPATLPTLTYYCPFFPGICPNIRSHPDWNSATDSMVLTYDPFDGGKRRNQVCTTPVKKAMQSAGSCDPRQHDTSYWKVSCDEFPFSSSLEGGGANSVKLAVTDAEQNLQGTLQSSITHLRRVKNNGKTAWGKPVQCHRYLVKLLNAVPAGAPANAIGSLDPGSAFFSTGKKFRYVTNRHALTPVPPAFGVDTPYPATATALIVPKLTATFNCAPCPPKPKSSSPDLGSDEHFEDLDEAPETAADAPSPTSAPQSTESSALLKREAPTCTRPPSPPLPSSSAAASSVAAASASTASAAAAAAAAAVASASNASAAQAAAAAAAVQAANILGPAAAALAAASNNAALASAIASAQAAVAAAQSALSSIFSLGPSLPDWLTKVEQQVSAASSSVANAVASSANVIKPTTAVPPDVDPGRDPVINGGPPPGTPAAACFGAGSKGFIMVGDVYLVNENGKAPTTLVDAGSKSYFGLTIPSNIALKPLGGCNNVYSWQTQNAALQPDFQVDCTTHEFGSYWSGTKQQCYAYDDPVQKGVFVVVCGNNIGSIYTCLQQQYGLYGTINPAFFTWTTS